VQIEIKPTRYGASVAQRLIGELMEDLTERYGGPDETPVRAAEFDPPNGGFFVAYLDGQPVGCGAWRGHDDAGEVAEVKRIFVAKSSRGLGMASRIMTAIEDDARDHGRNRIILETGTGQPEAIAMYEALGYERIEPFGFYRNEPGVRCFAKKL
jgi:GNAT superfamily N-acetyltransferase